MGKQKTSPLAQLLSATTLKVEAPKTVALSWNEIASPEFTKGAEGADQSITTAGEKQYLADVIAKQKQEQRLEQEKINKEAQEIVKVEVDTLTKQKEELDKKIETLEKNNLAGPGPKPFYSGESIEELTAQRNDLTEALAKKSAIFKNNPETQKKIGYADKIEKSIYFKGVRAEPLVGDMEYFSWKEDNVAVFSNPSIWAANFLKNLPAMAMNAWLDAGEGLTHSTIDEKEEVERRSKLPTNNSNYIDKKKYEEGKQLRNYANQGLISLAIQEKQKEKQRVQAVASTSNNPFDLDKIKTTFTLNRIERDIEDLEAARDKKSGASNYGRELLGKTLIAPTANITFFENIRTNQFDYWIAQEVEEDLNEKLKAKAKVKGVKDLSQLSEDDFKEVYDGLSPLDKILVESKYTSMVSRSLAEEEQTLSYKTVKNTGASADFIVSLLITRGGGRLLSGTAKAATKALGRTASVSETGLLARTLTNRGVTAKAAETMVKRANTAAGVVGQGTAITYLNPRELTGPRYSRYKSIDDEEGKVKAVFSREGAYALVKKEVEEDKKAYTKVYDYLKANEDSLQEDDRNLLRFLSGSLGYTKDEKYVNDKGDFVPVESLDEKLKAYEVNSKLYVHGRGIVSNIIETGTEIYTGKVLGKLGKYTKGKVGALAEKVPFANRVLVSASGKMDNFQKWYATTKLGRVQRDYEFFTGKYFGNFQKTAHVGGVGEEIIEEYAAAASNSLVDWDATEIKEAFTMDFLGEVTAQTLLLTKSMQAGGAGATLTKRLYGNLYDRKLKKIDDEIASLNKFLESNPEDADTLLSIKNLEEEKAKTVKNSSLTGLGISKRINKDHNAFSNTRRYLDQKAAMRRAIDDLKGATTDEDLNRILDLLDTTNSSDEARVREAFTLRNTGKVAEAEKLEEAIDKSTFMSALSTKSEKDLQGALNSVLKDSSRTLSAEQRQRLTNLNDTLEEVVKFQEENKDTKGNLQLATMFKAEQLSAKKAKQTIIDQRNSLREGAVQEFEAIFDTYFSNSGLDKAEATQAFVNGTLMDNSKFDPIIEKANTLNSKGFIGYTSSFLTEERLLNGLNSLDLAIQETLNPEPHIVERNNFNEEFIGMFNDLYQGKLDDLSSLGINDVEFDENNKVIFTPKLYAEILDKLAEKYVAENKLTAQQMAEVKLKNKTLVDAFLARQKDTAKKLEELERMMEEQLKVEEEETTSEEPEVVVVDVDSFVETQEVIEEVTSQMVPEPVTGTVTVTTQTPALNTLQETVLKARQGDQKAQKELENYGVEWDEKAVKYRQIGEQEAENLLKGEKIEPTRNGTYLDISDFPSYWGDQNTDFPYRVTFKDSMEFDSQMTSINEGGRVTQKNKEQGEYGLHGGYTLQDVAVVEKMTENGWEVVYDAKNGKKTLKPTTTTNTQSEIDAKKAEVERLREEEKVENAAIKKTKEEDLEAGYSVQTRMIDAAFQANAKEFTPKPYPSKEYNYPSEITHNGVVYKLGSTVNDHFTVTNTETGFQTKHTHTAIYNITDPKSTQFKDRQAELDKEIEKIKDREKRDLAETYNKYDKLISPLLREIDSLQATAIRASEDSLMDDTEVKPANNQNIVPDLSIDLGEDSEKVQQEKAKNVELYEKLLNHFLPKIRESLDHTTTDVIYVLEEILNISTPEQKQKLSFTIGSFIKAWKKLNLPITESQAQQVNRMAKAKFQSDVLSQFHSIFEQIVSDNETTTAEEYDTKSEEVDNEVKEVEVVTTPVVELTPAQIEEAPLNLEDLEEKQKKELQQEILSGEHPLSAKVAELTELGVDFWEAYAVALTGVTEDTQVVKEETEFYFTPFLGFNALPYEWYSYTDKNGIERLAKRTIAGAQLNVSQNDRFIRPDFRDLLHPDKYNTGSTFNIEVAKEEDWENIIYKEITSDTEVTLEDGRVIPAGTKTIISFADFMRSKPANFRNTEEFQGLIPVFMTDNTGKRLAYIHTLDWYTPDTIPNPNPLDESTATNPSQEWLDHIEKYKEGTKRLRTAISKGLTKVSIEKPAEGKAGMLAASETRISVQQSNPQAVMVVQRGATMKDFLNGVIKSDPEFATGNKVLMNDAKEFTPQKNKKGQIVNPDGHTWAIYRVGSKPHPTKPGEMVKTYRAIRLGSQVEESHIETIRWAIAAFKTLNGESIPKHMEAYSFADNKDAQKVAAGINAATGLDISKLDGLSSFMRMFVKIDYDYIKEYEDSVNKKKKEGEKKARYGVQSAAPYINYLFNKDIPAIELLYGMNDRADNKPVVSQHTNEDVLRTKSTGRTKLYVPQITSSGVTPYLNAQGESMSYQDYLKDTLYTNYKAFDMDTTGQAPMYSLTVQPKILINYNNEDIDSSKSVVSATEIALQEKIEEAAKESLKEIEETPKQLTEEEAEKEFEAIIKRLKALKVDYTMFMEGDESVGSLDELKKLFDLTADLSVNQEKTILGQISAEINSLLGFRAKVNSKSINKIKNEVRSTINKKLRERLSELILFRSTITNSGVSNPKTAALLKAIEFSINNITSMQQEYDTLFAKALKESLAETKVTQVGEQEDQEENELEKEKNFSKESVEEKLKDKASSQIRMMMHSIPMFDTQGEIVTGYLDLPSYMSLNDTYNLVLRTVSANIDTRADFNEIMDKLSKSEHPAIKILVERLTGADQQIKNQFVYNITAHALSSKFVMYDDNKGKISLKLYDTNSSEINRQIKQRWIENSKFTNLYHEDGSFNTVYAQGLINDFEKFGVNPIEAKESDLRGWLEKLGITMHNKTWEKLYTQGYKKGNQTTSFFTLLTHKKFGLYPNLIAFLKAGIADTEENYRANSVNDILSNIGGISNSIALIEADYNPELISLSYQDNGKSIFTLTPPKYITERITSLIRREGDKASQLVEDLLEISYNKNSMILGLLGQDSEMADLLRVHHISLGAIKDRNQKDSQGKITELSALDYDMFALGGLQDRKVQSFSSPKQYEGIPLRIANMLSSTMSDKDTALFFTVPVLDLLADANYSFYKDEEGNLKMTDKLLDVLVNLVVRPELERIINFNANVEKTGVKNYNIAAKFFHNIPALNSLQVKGMNLAEYLNSQESSGQDADTILNLINVDVKNRLQRVVTAEANAKNESWKELGLVQKGKSKTVENKIFNDNYFTERGIDKDPVKDFDLGVMDFVINSLIFQAESTKVFSGDIAQFSQDKLWYKAMEKASARDKVTHSLYSMSTEDYIKINKEIGTNLGKRLAYEIAPGKQGAVTEENRFYNQIFLQDSKDIAENTLDLIEMYQGLPARKKSEKSVRKYKLLQNKLASLQDKTSLTEKEGQQMQVVADEIEKIREQLIKNYPNLKDYFEIESTDAQEYTTVTEHLQILDSLGRITKEQYNRIISALASESSLEEEDLKIVMQPIKPMHGGAYVMKDMDMERIVYVKSSSFPLIPELTKGTSLDKLRVAMERLETETGRFTRASYQSANKVGAVVNPINPLDALSLETIFNYKDSANTDPSSPMLVLDRNNFRIQQDVPFKSGKAKPDTNAMGTQIFKMLFSNDIISGETFYFKGEKKTGRELYEIYENTFSKIIDYETSKLYKDLGLNENGEVTNEKVFMSKLRDVLEEEAVNRGYSIREIRNLQLVELIDINTKETYYDFKTPLWLSSNSNKYEALLNSIITNRIMQFKMPGSSFIAGSENGFRLSESVGSLSPKQQNKIIYLEGWNGQELQGTHFTEEDGAPVFTSAQVMVSSKIKGANNKLIDLFEGYDAKTGDVSKALYVKRNDNGTLGLKEDMLDPEMLKMFSFRTPTSSHISGSSIEIVGILPPSCGDLMLVPKNFTKQKGLDFDIDKEGAYSFNHYIDQEGKVKIIDERYLREVLKGNIRVSLINTPDFDATQYYQNRRNWFSDRRKDLKSIKVLKNAIKNKKIIESEIEDLNYILSVKQKEKNQDEEAIADLGLLVDQANLDLETINEVIEDIEKTTSLKADFNRDQFQAEKEKMIDEYAILYADLEKIYFKEVEDQHVKSIGKKIAQNDFTRVYLAVYDSPSKEVQKKLNSILSMEVASGQAETIASWKEEGIRNAFIEKQVALGKNRKEAADMYKEVAENFTMLSYSYQKAKMDLGAIGKKAIGVYATAATFAALIQTKYPKGLPMKAFTIGNMVSSKVGAINSLNKKNQRTLSDILGERINTATDNEKEQILGRVGVDDMTIGTDSFLALAGFDLGETGNSVSYMLLSQPAVVEFNKKIKESKGIIGEWIDEKKLIAEMMEKLTANESQKMSYVKNPDKGTWHFFGTNALGIREELKGGSSLLVEEALEEGIKSGKASGLMQAHALMTYIQAKGLADRLTPMISALNTNSLGKSIPEAMLKHSKIAKAMFGERPVMEGFINLVGEEVFDPQEGYPFEVMNAEGLPEVHYIKPTTPQGKIAITGLHLGKVLFENLFTYNDADLKETTNIILNLQEIDEDRVTAEDTEFIVQEFKKYLLSNPKLSGNFQDSSLKRYELMTDNTHNTSLAKYIHSLFKNKEVQFAKGVEAIKNNPLVGKRLLYKIGKGEEEVSTITFNNSSTDSLSDEELYLSLPSLMIDNFPLPDRNGKPYSTQDLVEDLVAYSFLEGGVQKATQFIKFVPIELQAEIGKVSPQTGAFISINDQLQNYNPRRIPISQKKEVFGVNEMSGFISQFFQNNPTLSPRISYKDAKLNINENNRTLSMTPERAAVSTPKIVHFIDRNKEVHLFQHIGQGQYTALEHNTLAKNTSQYNKGKSFQSIKGPEVRAAVMQDILGSVTHDFKIQENMSLEEALDQIATLSVPTNRQYLNQLAALFRVNLDEGKTFSAQNIGSRGRAIEGNVIMDINYLLNKNTSNEKISETIIHEVVHSLTVKELDRYFYIDNTTGSYELIPEYATGEFPLPTHVAQLNATYRAFLTSSLIDPKRLAKLKDHMKKIKDRNISAEEIATYTDELKTMFTPEEFKIYYAGTNIKEFMSVLFESAEFRQQLDNVEYKKSGQSLLERIADALAKILDSIFPGLRDNYLAKEALLASFRFMEQERKFNFEVDISVSLTDKNLDAEFDSSFGVDIDDKDPDMSLEVSQEEWDSLTEEEKQRIKDCI
jgi:hypothetical protein